MLASFSALNPAGTVVNGDFQTSRTDPASLCESSCQQKLVPSLRRKADHTLGFWNRFSTVPSACRTAKARAVARPLSRRKTTSEPLTMTP